ncbi:hypothetical protein B0T22DRAFT_482821 [Podospora appendiculata]|uniref:C2H2-type domain-containing protein n=1 Tax=Podospora appendiculata TaxID=314037 RepID=A0AAE0X6J8_9PEZI|nr:hypothetical protein B0T22DRAFT_482821 [Podospora appendiculata]
MASISENIKDELGRFRVWIANIGAHQSGRSSLDYRLRDASNIKTQVVKLLQNLTDSLNDEHGSPLDEESKSAAPEEETDSEDEDEPALEDELCQILFSIVEVINCLFRLSVSIRNPTPHDRFKRSAFTDTSTYEPYDIGHVRMKFPSAEGPIVDRVGKSISRRRQFFKYRELHHQKLARGLEHDSDELAVPEDTGKSTIASSIPQHLKTSMTGNRMNPETVNEDELSDGGRSQATSYATASTTNTARPKIPPMPKQATGEPFECPFCFQIILVTSKAAWKKHVFADLRPYVCLSTDCPLPDQDFRRRHHWVSHVKQLHWKTWTCPEKGCAGSHHFESAMQMKSHILKEHPNASDSKQLESLLLLSEQPKSLGRSAECPLCHAVLGNFTQYQRHVGRHQEDLALFALPSLEADGSDQDRDEDEEEDVDKSELEESHEAEDVKGEWPDFFKGDRESGVEEEPNREPRELRSWWSFVKESGMHDWVDELFKPLDEPDRSGHLFNRPTSPSSNKTLDESATDSYIEALGHSAPVPLAPSSRAASLTQASPSQAAAANPKDEVEDSAEMQEAAEQLKALSHVRHMSDEILSVMDPSPGPDDDVLLMKYRGVTYPEHFPAYSIGDGKLYVRDLQDRMALFLNIPLTQAREILMRYKGETLKDPHAPLHEYGVKHNSEIVVFKALETPGTYSSRSKDDDTHNRDDIFQREIDETIYKLEAPETPRTLREWMRSDDTFIETTTAFSTLLDRLNTELRPDDLSYRAAPSISSDDRDNAPERSEARSADVQRTTDKISALSVNFNKEFLPLCIAFIANPPENPDERKAEQYRLAEMLMQKVLLPVNAIEACGLPGLRKIRRTLIRRVSETLRAMGEKLNE